MHVEEHESLEELLKLTRQQKRVREHRRFQAVVLARQGKTAGYIAATLNCGLRRVQRWIERYNKGRISRSGRRPGAGSQTSAGA